MEDSEEEDVIVYASFEKGTIEKDMFNVPDLHWKIIGLESDTPILQLGDTTFKGSYNVFEFFFHCINCCSSNFRGVE